MQLRCAQCDSVIVAATSYDLYDAMMLHGDAVHPISLDALSDDDATQIRLDLHEEVFRVIAAQNSAY